MQCRLCGTELPVGAAFCPTCGAAMSASGKSPDDPTAAASPSGAPLQALSSDYGSPLYAGPQQYPYQPLNPYAIPPPPPPSPSRSKPRRWGIWMLILVIVGVGVYGGIKGVISATNVTPSTPQVTATAQATLTAVTAAENPYTHRGTLVLSDPLSDNSPGHGWTEESSSIGSCQFTGRAYHVIDVNPNGGIHCAASQDFSDFTFEVQMMIMKGDNGGVVFRLDSVQNTRYDFFVGQDGTYELARFQGTKGQDLFHTTPSSAIHWGLGQTNVIAVVAQGSQMTLFVNRQLVARATDTTYTHGQLALLAAPNAPSGHPTEVVYSNAKVWTV